jgi:MFS family permease
MGSGLTAIAASILVFRETGSALSVGLMLLSVALPGLFVGLVAGVFVDRYDRKRIMIAANLIRAVLIAAIPLLLPSGIGWLYVLVFLSSTVAQFYAPAEASVLPEVASDDELAAATSMMAVSGVGALTVGYAAAGLIATEASLDWAFYVDAATFLGSALCIAFVRIPPLAVEGKTNVGTIVRHLRAGLDVVRTTPTLRSLLVIFAVMFLTFGLWNALVLPFAIRALDATEFEYSLLEGLFAVGFVVGSLAMARYIDRLHEGQWIVVSILGMGVLGAAFALAQSVPVALAIFVAGGILNAPSYIGRSLLIQRNTTRDVRGRVNSAFLVTRDLTLMVGMAAAGLADLINVRLLLLACGALQIGCALVALRLPGLGQPTAEWRRALAMLRAAPSAPGLGLGRAALPADVDLLAARLPAFGGLSQAVRRDLAAQARVYEALAGTAVVRTGEAGDAAYFLLDGRTVASRSDDGTERVLEVHNAGDFFGEIAAITGMPRTATVVAERPTSLLQVPAAALRRLMADPDLNRVFLTKMTERMARLEMIELPRFSALDQATLRELRTPVPEAEPAPGRGALHATRAEP